jgi:hypothetical protein
MGLRLDLRGRFRHAGLHVLGEELFVAGGDGF